MKSRVPYGVAGWIAAQTIMTIQGLFDPFCAMLSLAPIVLVIAITEKLVDFIWKRRNEA